MWVRFAVSLLLAAAALGAHAQSLESVVMPGQVIRGHADLEKKCSSCHKRFERAAQSGLCADCHKDIGADIRAKTGHHGRVAPAECRSCHTEHKGRDARIVGLDEQRFDHRETDFPLSGAHAQASCAACHRPGAKHRAAPSACIACHRKDDRHKGSLGSDCGSCHSDATWKEARFDHGKTRFALRLTHTSVACRACHVADRYAGTPRACAECHAKQDVHKGRLGPKCESCHRENRWKTIIFDHGRDARFPLRGAHGALKCDSCHRAPPAREKLQTTCIACHRADDAHGGRLGARCERCHDERSWKSVSTFSHDRDTEFPLKYRHRAAKCQDCHKDQSFKQKPSRECAACHRKDDAHKGRFGSNCASCHSEKSWTAAQFDHERDAHFPLRGAHRTLKCDSCHRSAVRTEKPRSTCNACHAADDKHRGQLGPRCESCHSERSWKPARFDHNRSAFPLLGKHARVECRSCHASLAFKDAARQCVGCHEKDDAHRRRLGPRCEDCHNARDWRVWDFDHGRRTQFALAGGHRGIACTACHRAAAAGRPVVDRACGSCHARDDAHQGQFGPQCDRCHGVDDWRTLKRRPGTASLQ